MASWEIARVPPGGLSFFPTGESELSPVPPHFFLPTEKVHGTTFYDHACFDVGKGLKLHADGRGGYLAHVMGDLLLLKIFSDTRAVEQAPGEGECELYANEDGRYVEIEVQGAYSLILPGSRSSFHVRTAVCVLPTAILREHREGLRRFADERVEAFR
jgi:hypothetical protein